MATIIEKQTRRNRVQFSMPRQLYDAHQQNLELAKSLGAIIDFNRDFERWFSAQVDHVAKELLRLKEEEEKKGSTGRLQNVADRVDLNHSFASDRKNENELPKKHEVANGND
jgi:hypothetical protein